MSSNFDQTPTEPQDAAPPEPLDLAAIRARAEGGTEGTWTADRQTGQIWANPGEPVLVAQVGWAEDADFIAHAREDVPALLAALDAAEEESERLRSALDHLREDDALNRDAYLLVEAQRDEARAALAALREECRRYVRAGFALLAPETPEWLIALDAALAAAAPVVPRGPDEREALDIERLPERFRFSREVYGDVADDATRVLLALTDGGHADQPSDHLRWVSITAAQALAARPAPVVSEERLSGPAVDHLPVGSVVLDYEGEAWQRVALGMWVCTSGDTARSLAWTDEPAEHQKFRVLYRPTVADTPAAEDEGGQER